MPHSTGIEEIMSLGSTGEISGSMKRSAPNSTTKSSTNGEPSAKSSESTVKRRRTKLPKPITPSMESSIALHLKAKTPGATEKSLEIGDLWLQAAVGAQKVWGDAEQTMCYLRSLEELIMRYAVWADNNPKTTEVLEQLTVAHPPRGTGQGESSADAEGSTLNNQNGSTPTREPASPKDKERTGTLTEKNS
eukprot:Clim_evm20s196 gene=Clim_evmTU20s196